jgi:hypothetical protein
MEIRSDGATVAKHDTWTREELLRQRGYPAEVIDGNGAQSADGPPRDDNGKAVPVAVSQAPSPALQAANERKHREALARRAAAAQAELDLLRRSKS